MYSLLRGMYDEGTEWLCLHPWSRMCLDRNLMGWLEGPEVHNQNAPGAGVGQPDKEIEKRHVAHQVLRQGNV